jgi:hypothetical protein
MAAAEAHRDGESLVVGEETVLRDEPHAADANLVRGSGTKVAHPVDVGAPGRADDHFADGRLVTEDHRDGLVRLARPPSHVHEEQERATEHPTPSAAVQAKWHPKHEQRQTTGSVAQPDKWPASPTPLERRRLLIHRRQRQRSP